jgi:TatD DNase family protein
LLLDFHHHHLPPLPEQQMGIRSFHQGEREAFAAWEGLCSVGLHPWLVAERDVERDEQWTWFESAARQEKVILLGECGLDRLRGVDLSYQILVFEHVLILAKALQKPLVIHCVRAYNELVSLAKRVNPGIPLVIHGFNRKPDLLHALLGEGFYFSFGAAILHEKSPAVQSLALVPADRFFLETDDQLISIEAVYQQAARVRGLSGEDLTKNISDNWQALLRT